MIADNREQIQLEINYLRTLTLEEILTQAINNDHLALFTTALGKSRIDHPSEESVRLTCELIRLHGNKWIEVL